MTLLQEAKQAVLIYAEKRWVSRPNGVGWIPFNEGMGYRCNVFSSAFGTRRVCVAMEDGSWWIEGEDGKKLVAGQAFLEEP